MLVGAAFAIFRYLGSKWIEQKFSKELEDHKHTQAIELQRLSVEIDTKLSGSLFAQKRELEEIEECWELLLTAIGKTATLVSAFQSFPPLDRFSDEQLEEFFLESELYESQKQEIRNAQDRLSAYISIINLHRIANAKKANSNLYKKINAVGVFLDEDLDKMFHDASDAINRCISRFNAGLRGDYSDKISEANDLFEDEVIKLRNSIRSNVASRIRSL